MTPEERHELRDQALRLTADHWMVAQVMLGLLSYLETCDTRIAEAEERLEESERRLRMLEAGRNPP